MAVSRKHGGVRGGTPQSHRRAVRTDAADGTNTALNDKDGFELDEIDSAIFASHDTQLVGHFLVDAAGIVRWVQIEAVDGPNGPIS